MSVGLAGPLLSPVSQLLDNRCLFVLWSLWVRHRKISHKGAQSCVMMRSAPISPVMLICPESKRQLGKDKRGELPLLWPEAPQEAAELNLVNAAGSCGAPHALPEYDCL